MFSIKKLRGFPIVVMAFALSFMLSGCGERAVMLPPNADFYVLDLSDSGKADDQFERISQEVLRSLTRNSLGQPFVVDGMPAYGPIVTTFSFVGNNSRFLKTFQLQDYEKVNELYDIVKEDTRAQSSWEKLTSTYQSILEPLLISDVTKSFSRATCLQKFDSALKDYFSGNQTRSELVEKLCQMATYTTDKYSGLVNYISLEKSEHKTSDVFGAIESVNNSLGDKRTRVEQNYWHYMNKSYCISLLSLAKGDACQQGQIMYEKLSASSLRGIDVELPGIGALLGNKAEYAGKIDKFWRCFFALSK